MRDKSPPPKPAPKQSEGQPADLSLPPKPETTKPKKPKATGGEDGRDKKSGRFVKGWRGGPGNPYVSKTAKLRQAIFDVVTPKEMRAIAVKLLALAKEGDIEAAELIMDRTLGKADGHATEVNVTYAVAQNVAIVNSLRQSLLEEPGYLDHLRMRSATVGNGHGDTSIICANGQPGSLANGTPSGDGGPSLNVHSNGKT